MVSGIDQRPKAFCFRRCEAEVTDSRDFHQGELQNHFYDGLC